MNLKAHHVIGVAALGLAAFVATARLTHDGGVLMGVGAAWLICEGGYEMLRAAVNTAREHQCRSLLRLKERLAAAWPDRAAEIDEALAYWSADIRRRHPNGVPRH